MASVETNNQDFKFNCLSRPERSAKARFLLRQKPGLFTPGRLSEGFVQSVAASSCQKTHQGKCPSLLLPIEVRNIQRAKHGSDTGVCDSQGREFEEIFRKHARRHADALTSNELDSMLKENRVPKDYSGWVGSYVEWKLLYYPGKDKNGLLHKGTERGVYDGSLFHQMEKDHSSRNAL